MEKDVDCLHPILKKNPSLYLIVKQHLPLNLEMFSGLSKSMFHIAVNISYPTAVCSPNFVGMSWYGTVNQKGNKTDFLLLTNN